MDQQLQLSVTFTEDEVDLLLLHLDQSNGLSSAETLASVSAKLTQARELLYERYTIAQAEKHTTVS